MLNLLKSLILIKEKQIQLTLFDHGLGEIQMDNGVRYVLRRNPERTREIRQSRDDKYQALSAFIEKQNKYLLEKTKAKVSVAERKINEAQAKARSNEILNASLTSNILKDKGIEATLELANSPNSKIVIVGSDGSGGLPMILGGN